MHNKILVITGPTATGKSALAVEIAKAFSGEIISADSRQVYRGLDIGSAKITTDEMQGIPHYLIDIADPKDIFTVSEFKKLTQEKIDEIHARGNLPILCGGTGMYISAVIDDLQFPEVPPNAPLRTELERLTTQELFEKLEGLDPDRASEIDEHNKPRLIRALEIANALGTVPKRNLQNSKYEVLIIGLELPKEELVKRIETRITDRIPALFDEIKKLLTEGVSEERLHAFGLEYRYGLDYVKGARSLLDFQKTLATKTWQYVKRQLTWWKRDSRVIWMNPILDKQKILQIVQDFF